MVGTAPIGDNAADVVVKFDSIIYDTHLGYNPTTGFFTVPEAG
jgi:hypothetical protein